jgi:uncharacterized membrane protein (UPF0127 family)
MTSVIGRNQHSGRARFLGALLFCVLGLLGLQPASAGMRMDRLWLLTASGERQIEIEVAETDEDKALGLMFRTSLPDDHGMLFPSKEPHELTMWMRNTYIPLDMVFIDGEGRIQQIVEQATPHSLAIINSNEPALAVLEIAGGEAKRLGLHPGQRVLHAALVGYHP